MEWKTIDSAPRDGTMILLSARGTVTLGAWNLYFHDKMHPWVFVDSLDRALSGCCDHEAFDRIEANGYSVNDKDLMWMPLPLPPTPDTGAE